MFFERVIFYLVKYVGNFFVLSYEFIDRHSRVFFVSYSHTLYIRDRRTLEVSHKTPS